MRVLVGNRPCGVRSTGASYPSKLPPKLFRGPQATMKHQPGPSAPIFVMDILDGTESSEQRKACSVSECPTMPGALRPALDCASWLLLHLQAPRVSLMSFALPVPSCPRFTSHVMCLGRARARKQWRLRGVYSAHGVTPDRLAANRFKLVACTLSTDEASLRPPSPLQS